MTDSPSFEHPPVIETVLGVQFGELPSLKNAHLGAFWKQLGQEWQTVEDVAPLPQEFERFGDEQAWALLGALSFRLAAPGPIRMQIRKASGDRMIQIQNGRLHYNWLGEGEHYARYPQIRDEFWTIWDRFQRFVSDEGIGAAKPNQWEVTYVNHMAKGTLWESCADWHSVFAGGVGVAPPAARSVVIEALRGEWHYEIRPRLGRLHVELQHGRRGSSSGQEVLVLKLTARGPLEDASDAALRRGLDLGHNVIVQSFREMASEKARAYWKELV